MSHDDEIPLPRNGIIEWQHLDKRKYYAYGPLVFSMVRFISHPAMLIKTRLQVQRQQPNSRNIGTLQAVSQTLRNEGIRGLYRGFGVNSLNLVVGQFYISLFEYMKSQLDPRTSSVPRVVMALGLDADIYAHQDPFSVEATRYEATRTLFAAGTAVLLSQAISNPIDVVAQRIMVGRRAESVAPTPNSTSTRSSQPSISNSRPSSSSSSSSFNNISHGSSAGSNTNAPAMSCSQRRSIVSYSAANAQKSTVSSQPVNPSIKPWVRGFQSHASVAEVQNLTMRQVLQEVLKKDGIRGLYRGYFASIAQNAPSSVMWWTSYGVFRKLGMGFIPNDSPNEITWKRITETCSGACAGATVAVICTPLDVIRTRVQVEGKNVSETVRILIREEGAGWLMKGCGPRLWMMMPNGAVIMSAYELVKRLSLRDDVRARWKEEEDFSM